MDVGAQALEPSSAAFPGHQHVIGSEMELPGFEPVSGPGATRGLEYNDMSLVPRNYFQTSIVNCVNVGSVRH